METTMYDRIKHNVKTDKVAVNDIMAFTYLTKVKRVEVDGSLIVTDLEGGCDIKITGNEIIERSTSADQFQEELKVSMTQAAELLVHSTARPFTVTFLKKDGEERTIRGRLIRPEPLLGRSMVEDFEADPKNRTRQVDHRTIVSLIVDGVKYVVK